MGNIVSLSSSTLFFAKGHVPAGEDDALREEVPTGLAGVDEAGKDLEKRGKRRSLVVEEARLVAVGCFSWLNGLVSGGCVPSFSGHSLLPIVGNCWGEPWRRFPS